MEMISKYFSFEDLTSTSIQKLQVRNRVEAENCRTAIVATAKMMDGIADGLGFPLDIHSGFRGPSLNAAIGGSPKSQHLVGQACDFSLKGITDDDNSIDKLFQEVLSYLIENGVVFGQLIREFAARPYGVALWVHVSLGEPWRDITRCGQVLTLQAGNYTLLKTVPFGH